jgi:hypothetical protein
MTGFLATMLIPRVPFLNCRLPEKYSVSSCEILKDYPVLEMEIYKYRYTSYKGNKDIPPEKLKKILDIVAIC